MTKRQAIQLFEERKVRTAWDSETEKWYFSVVDVCAVLTEQLFRIIQSISSPKAEPFKLWMAKVAALRTDQMQDPELSIDQAIADYRRLGYSEAWINQRIKSVEVRKHLTDEWKRAGLEEG